MSFFMKYIFCVINALFSDHYLSLLPLRKKWLCAFLHLSAILLVKDFNYQKLSQIITDFVHFRSHVVIGLHPFLVSAYQLLRCF